MLATGPRTTSTPGDQFRLEEERAVGVVAGALEILPRAVDHDRDAAEVLQAADVDRGLRLVAALWNQTLGMPKNRSEVRVGRIWSSLLLPHAR